MTMDGTALVLDGHSRAAVEVVQALGRLGVCVDVGVEGEKCAAFQSKYARGKLRQPSPASPDEFARWLRARHEERSYTLIVAATESSLLSLRALPPDDPLRVKAVLPSNEALDAALNKQTTWELARRLGVRVPDSVLIERLEAVPQVDSYPVILKPVSSKVIIDGRLVTLAPAVVRDDRERLSYLKRWLSHVAVQQQSYVYGHGVGVEFLYDRGRKLWHFAHERIHEYPLTGGGSTYRRSLWPDPQLLHASEQVLNALAWHGVAMLEFKVEPAGGYCLMEINPRLWGSLALAVDAGVNFPLGVLRLACGMPPLPQPAYRRSYYTRYLPGDLVWLRENMRAEHGDALLLTRSRLMSVLEYCRPLIGRESWDHFDVRDLGVTRVLIRKIVSDHAGLLRAKAGAWMLARKARRRHRVIVSRSGPPVNSLLFLCHGNICRSPFAEQWAKRKLPEVRIASAGFHERGDRSPPGDILAVAASMGVSLSHSRSKRVTRALIDAADLILVMDMQNYASLAREFPQALDRTTLLGFFAEEAFANIRDPYQSAEEEIRRVFAQISVAVDGLSAWMERKRSPTGARTPYAGVSS
jgi:protein-tyrosine-phosphatase/predicted ATP-grasp superfamily ATP-dependent carboligase